MKIIDAHSHIGNFGSWARFDFDLARLKEQMEKFDIEKTLLSGAGAGDYASVLDAFQKEPDLVVPIAWVKPGGPEALDEMRRLVECDGFRAFKLHPLFDAYCADDTVVDPVLDLAEELRVPVFIHSGHPPYSLPWQIGWLVEWWYAVADGGEAGAAFLGSQGDVWDAQKDILCDTLGAICSSGLYLCRERKSAK